MSHNVPAYAAIGLLTFLLIASWFAVHYLLIRALTPRVFLSYRRDDTKAMANRLCVDLKDRYGDTNVFMDTQDIPYGKEYPGVLVEWLSASNAVVALVGPRWDGGLGNDGYPRILNANDWVRREVEEGFRRRRLVVCRVCETASHKPPEVPEYTEDQLARWGLTGQPGVLADLRPEEPGVKPLGRAKASLTEIGHVEFVKLIEDADGYRGSRKALFGEIDRLHRGSRAWLLLQAWRWPVVPLVVSFGVVAYLAVTRANTVADDQSTRMEQADRALEAEIRRRDPALILPYTAEQFADVVRKDPEKYAQQFGGSYVAWRTRFVAPDLSPTNGKAFVQLRAAADPPFSVNAMVDEKAFNRLPEAARRPGAVVWVVGAVKDCTRHQVDLVAAHLMPDASSLD